MSLVYLSGPITVRIAANDVAYIQGTPPIYPVPVPTGAQGLPGFSPAVTVTDITGGHRVTITDKDHPTGVSFDVMDGEKGEQGEPGIGIASGGTTGQVLAKKSNTDYDTEWVNQSGNVTSVNGQTGDVVISVPSASTATPADLGTASAGSSANFARSDHVHKMPSASDVGALPSSTSIPQAATATPADLGTAAVGSSAKYAKEDHAHNMPSASDVGAMAKWVLLWENASPDTDFAAQTVQIDTTYDMYMILCDPVPNYNEPISFITPNGKGVFMSYTSGYSRATNSRDAQWSAGNGFAFLDAYSNGSQNNGVCIPTDIYGIKGVITT